MTKTGGYPPFFFSSRRRHTRCSCDWSSDVCSSDLVQTGFDDLDILFDVDDAGKAVDRIGHQHAAVAELVVVVFDVEGPVMGKRPVDAAAHGPAEAVVQAFKGEGGAGE